jgi:hypothetical protein
VPGAGAAAQEGVSMFSSLDSVCHTVPATLGIPLTVLSFSLSLFLSLSLSFSLFLSLPLMQEYVHKTNMRAHTPYKYNTCTGGRARNTPEILASRTQLNSDLMMFIAAGPSWTIIHVATTFLKRIKGEKWA